MNLLQFFQSSSGENSSKRLAFLASIVVACYGVIETSNKLVAGGHPNEAITLWSSFFIFAAFLGGFVTAELLVKLLQIFKNGTISNSPINDNSSNPSMDNSEPKSEEQRIRD